MRSGSITQSQFRLGLNMAKLPLSKSEFDLLVEYFKCEEKEGFVKWRKFCDVIEEVFMVKGLEKTNPNLPVPVPNLTYNYGKKFMTEAEIRTAEFMKKK